MEKLIEKGRRISKWENKQCADGRIPMHYAFVLQQNSLNFPEMSRQLKGRMWRCLVLSKVAPLRCTLKSSGGFCGLLRTKRLELRWQELRYWSPVMGSLNHLGRTSQEWIEWRDRKAEEAEGGSMSSQALNFNSWNNSAGTSREKCPSQVMASLVPATISGS